MAAQAVLADANRIKQDLAAAELILGVLRRKDASGKGVIHSSDFQLAVTDLGFPLGAPVIQDMLVHCKLDEKGNIDFGPLERELQSRRRVLTSMPPASLPAPATSVAAPTENMWIAGKIHQRRVNSAQQAKLVKDNRQELLHIFRRFSHGTDRQFGLDAVMQELEQLGIMCTRALRLLLEEKKGEKDVNFVTFCSVLTKYDPEEQDLGEMGLGAGLSSATPRATSGTNGSVPLRRADQAARMRMQERSDQEALNTASGIVVGGKGAKGGNRNALFNDTRSYADGALYKNSTQVFEALQPSKTGHQLSMLTHNQEQMAAGSTGVSPVVSYSSEIRLQREQVLAALRKLDSGQITLDEFHSKALAIGFDIPLSVLKMLHETTVVGRLDWRKIVRILDTTVFKAKAIDEAPSELAVESAIESILQFLAGQDNEGAAALVNLETAFRKMDSDRNDVLSLNEFKAGIASYNIDICDEDLRSLFHSLDKNGDGSLSIDEFIDMLRPPVPNARRVYIRNAFIKLDRFNARSVAIDDLVDGFNPNFHVDAVRGIKTPREVVTEMVNSFDVIKTEGVVSFARFYAYFASLSVFVESDDEFIDMMKNCWNICDKAPPPFIGVQVAGRKLNTTNSITPVDRQTYGDIISWNQEESQHEINTRKSRRDLSLLQQAQNNSSDVIRWSKVGPGEQEGVVGGFRNLSERRQELLKRAHVSSNVQGNIMWSHGRAGKSAGGGEDRSEESERDLPPPPPTKQNQAEPAAGSSLRDREKLRDSNNVRHSGKYSAMERRNFGGPTPFGVSYEVGCVLFVVYSTCPFVLHLSHPPPSHPAHTLTGTR